MFCIHGQTRRTALRYTRTWNSRGPAGLIWLSIGWQTSGRDNTPAGRFANALTFALTENWPGLLEWFRRNSSVPTSPGIFSLYLRALGETGELDELVRQLDAHICEGETSSRTHSAWRFNLALALAFCGRTDEFVRLTEGDRSPMRREDREFWCATAELRKGNHQLGLERLERLSSETNDAILVRAIAHRRSDAARPAILSATSTMLLDRLIAEVVDRRGVAMRTGWRRAPAVWALLVLNTASFGLELLFGGSTNSATLHYLGALEPVFVIVRHDYWRLLTAMFLHYGLLHLAVNLFALYLLGPPLERLIGSIKFVTGYLLSGIGSGVGVTSPVDDWTE